MKTEKIKKIEIINDIPDYVYNLEIEDNHNYFTNDILNHNCDDAQDPKLAASEIERKNTIEFYTGTLYSRLNQPSIGQRIIVQQRLAVEDLSGYLLANFPESYKHICIPCELYEDGKISSIITPLELKDYYIDGYFWRDRFYGNILRDLKKTLGSVQSAGQLQQRPTPAGGNMVKEEWFEIVDPENITIDLSKTPIKFYIDTAESEKEKENGDSTAIVSAFVKDNIVYICNIIEVKKEFFELVKFIPEFCKNNKYTQSSVIKIEPKSSGKSVVSQLKHETQLNIMELASPDKDKVTRLSTITAKLECGRVKLLRGNYIKPFMDQIKDFPLAKHDDMVDAFVHCVNDLIGGNDFNFAFV